MRAEAAVEYLLKNASALTALLASPGANSIYPGQAPQGSGLPVVVYEFISGGELTTIGTPSAVDAQSAFALKQARIQVTALASGATGDGYAKAKAVLEQVRIALNYQRGTFNGVRVVSIIRDTEGPDLRDDDRRIFSQSVDFQVTYQEP